MMNRTKAIVVAVFASYWVIVLAILVVARGLYDSLLAQAMGPSSDPRLGEAATFLALTALLAALSYGVIRGWRWLFWVILLAYLAGILHTAYAALQLAGMAPNQDPAWYVVIQGFTGLVQFVVALVMLAGYRAAGVWGVWRP